MKKVAVFYCKKIQDHTCLACAKCFKGASLKAGEFAQHNDDIEIAALTDCGDCPGLVYPRVPMILQTLKNMDVEVDAVHFGSCMKMAYEHGYCPMDLDEVTTKIREILDIPVIVGTHPYEPYMAFRK